MKSRIITLVTCLMLMGASALRAEGRTVLLLDNVAVANLLSVTGGDATAPVVTSAPDASGNVKKSLGRVQYEPIVLQVGASASKEFYQWIKDSFARAGTPKSGAVVRTDPNGKEIDRLEFVEALISETAFPALDGADKDPAYMTVTVAPISTIHKPGTGAVVPSPIVVGTPKNWINSNFRINLTGIDSNRVSKIDSITVTFKGRGSLVSNLAVSFPETSAQEFVAWHQTFVISGHNDPTQEKAGTLAILAPSLSEVYFTIGLHNMGIFRLTDVPLPTTPNAVRMMRAEMYVNEADFSF